MSGLIRKKKKAAESYIICLGIVIIYSSAQIKEFCCISGLVFRSSETEKHNYPTTSCCIHTAGQLASKGMTWMIFNTHLITHAHTQQFHCLHTPKQMSVERQPRTSKVKLCVSDDISLSIDMSVHTTQVTRHTSVAQVM